MRKSWSRAHRRSGTGSLTRLTALLVGLVVAGSGLCLSPGLAGAALHVRPHLLERTGTNGPQGPSPGAPVGPSGPGSSQSPSAMTPSQYAALLGDLAHFSAPRPGPNVKYEIGPTRNGDGYIIRRPGSHGNAETIRIMNGSKANPEGSLVYYSKHGHPINYKTGGVPRTRADWHVPGGNKVPLKNFPRWFTG